MIGKDFIQQYGPARLFADSTVVTSDIPVIEQSTMNDNRMTPVGEPVEPTNDPQMPSLGEPVEPTNDHRIAQVGEPVEPTNDHRITPVGEPVEPTSDIESLIQQIESSQIDITSTYESWLRILFALTDQFGEAGRDYAHRISQFYPGYKASECDKQFNYCLRAGKSGITIRTLFYIAQQHGILVDNKNSDWMHEFSIYLPSFSNLQIPTFSNSQSPQSHLSPQSDIRNPTSPNHPLSFLQREGVGGELLPGAGGELPPSDIRHPKSDILPPVLSSVEAPLLSSVEPPVLSSVEPPVLSSVEAFPIHIFPPPVADLISAAAKSIGCPPDFIAIPVLAVLATAIGNSRHLQVKKGWIEAPNIYSAIVAPPGSKKSPALSAATLPVREIQQAYSLEHKNAQDEYQSMFSAYNIQVELWKKRKPEDKDPADQPVPPVEPFMKQIKTNNATIEAIGNLLEQNPRGILFEQDELAAWAKSMNAYRSGKGSDLEIWLSFWSCIQTIINRAYRKVPQSIDKPHVTVTGCIQPDLLSELSGIKQNGFFDRILFAYPDSVPLHYSTDEISDFIATGYGDVVKTLFQLQPDILENHIQVPALMHFTIPARQEWENWNRLHDSEMNNPDLPYYLLGAWSKLQAYMARFTLILQLTANAVSGIDSRDIQPESVLAAAQLVAYFKSHTRKVYNALYNSEMDSKIGTALNWIKRHDGPITEKMLLNSKVGGCRSMIQVRELLQEMVDRQLGVLTSTTHPHGGRPIIKFMLKESAIDQNLHK